MHHCSPVARSEKSTVLWIPFPSQFYDTKEMAHSRKEGRERKKETDEEQKEKEGKEYFSELLTSIKVTHGE